MSTVSVAQPTERQPISRDQALQIARSDASRVYRDLSGYRVGIRLEKDRWHIDYELADPEVQGGGPHYVIDLESGRILAKRYEQ